MLTEKPSGSGSRLSLRISDDLISAKNQGRLKKTQLRLLFDNFTSQDKIEVILNGHRLPQRSSDSFDLVSYWNKSRGPYGGKFLTGTLEYDVDCPPLQQGKNIIQFRLVKRPPGLKTPLKLSMVEVDLKYQSA